MKLEEEEANWLKKTGKSYIKPSLLLGTIKCKYHEYFLISNVSPWKANVSENMAHEKLRNVKYL